MFSTVKTIPQLPQVSSRKHECGWENVEVLWELKVNEKEFNNRKFIENVVLKSAEVLRVQWTRRFVIVVFACGTNWRLCWFDRSGGATHEAVDINLHSRYFACYVLFPLLLPNPDLGMSESSTISVENQLFELGGYIFRPQTDRLINHGTSVRMARPLGQDGEWTLCAKSSWHYRERAIEFEALQAQRSQLPQPGCGIGCATQLCNRLQILHLQTVRFTYRVIIL
jgi:Fungal protein kinase